MKLQDRFGTDSRFKMGVNFMEDDEEDLGKNLRKYRRQKNLVASLCVLSDG